MSKCFFSGTDRELCTCDGCNRRRPAVHVLDFTCRQHGDYTVKVQCPLCEREALRDRRYRIDEWGTWAKELGHINPRFVDVFIADMRLAGEPEAATAIEWLDRFTGRMGEFTAIAERLGMSLDG